MKKRRFVALAGAAALAVAGVATAAGQKPPELKIALPDGSIAQIAYEGDVAPKVSVIPSLHFVPVERINPFDLVSFDRLERDAEQIDQQADALMRQSAGWRAAPLPVDGEIDLAAFSRLPAGAVSYSYRSSSDGRDSCYRSVQVTSYGAGSPPTVVSRGAGNCAAIERTPVRLRLDDMAWPATPVPPKGAMKLAQPSRPGNIV